MAVNAAVAYPTKPIRMLAPEPGGGNEIAGRTIAQALSDESDFIGKIKSR